MTIAQVVALLLPHYDGDYLECSPSTRALRECRRLIAEGVDERVVVAATERIHASGWLDKMATEVTAEDVAELVVARPWKHLKAAPTWSTWFRVRCLVPVIDPVVPTIERGAGPAYEFEAFGDDDAPAQRSLFGGGA